MTDLESRTIENVATAAAAIERGETGWHGILADNLAILEWLGAERAEIEAPNLGETK